MSAPRHIRSELSSGNVFADLGFEAAEAAVMQMRALLMIGIEERIKRSGWSEAQAARRLGVTSTRLATLMAGSLEGASLDDLVALAVRAGLRPQLKIRR